MIAHPSFAVIGHPNEGKSSVVATLVENDRIRISPTPGETVESTSYPVILDGETVISFVDTPGFQNPLQTLGWMRKYQGPSRDMLAAFLREFGDDPGMTHECELLRPVAAGSGVIYVVDASRPLRRVDRAEMEILRLTGRPRMAIINCKTGEEGFLEEWKEEFRKHFNMVRTFNAVRATFAERMRLLESLRSIDQDWEQALTRVQEAFVRDWDRRLRDCAALACRFLSEVLAMSETTSLSEGIDRNAVEQRLTMRLEARIRKAESELHRAVRAHFRHNVFQADLPEQSVLRQDLFSRATWRVLGLTRTQLAFTAAAAGGAAGAMVDMATAGHSLGLFAVLGGAVGGLAALVKGEDLVNERLLGQRLGSQGLQVGPVKTVQWVYVLLDRFLLYFWHAINWAHARPADHVVQDPEKGGKLGLTSAWSREARKLCADFYTARTEGREEKSAELEVRLEQFLDEELHRLSSS
ncbi:MAG: GTPase/DUF3482 domain-containing protein [Desulfovibrionales bacterium]|nr:GTPase/DUF3482 domain-containing protein [Desulfovibrionales bacterium]